MYYNDGVFEGFLPGEDEEARHHRLNRPRDAQHHYPDCANCTFPEEDRIWMCGECHDSHSCGGFTHVEGLGYMCDYCGGIYIRDF